MAKLGEMIAMDLQGGLSSAAAGGPPVQDADGVLARDADGSLTFTTTPRPS